MQMTDDLSSSGGIHHPIFGRVLKRRMDELGVRCDIYYRENFGDMDEGEAKVALAGKRMIFLRGHLL